MRFSLLFSALMLSACATADQVNELSDKLDTLTEKIDKLEKSGGAKAPAKAAAQVDQAAEKAAGELLKQMQEFIKNDDIAGAKAKLAELNSKYSATRTARRAAKMGKELEVFGKAAPASFDVDEWMIGNAGNVNLASGTTLLVFWELWCPHCKREVPELQATFEKYQGKGLQMVGLTKMSRNKSKEEVMGFLQSKNVSYPIAKENGKLSSHFNVAGIPAAAVVKDGKIVWRGHPARLDDAKIEGWLN